jgi:hypothetical protein
MSLKNVTSIKEARKTAKGYDLKVTLKKGKKGTSLFAKEPIKKGNVVAYYKFLLHPYKKNFKGYKNDMYVMSVYTQSERFNPHLIGDIYQGSLRKPKYNIPYWAYFSNEPSVKQTENCELDINTKYNYRKGKKLKAGDTMTYKIVAMRDIQPGEEICWCYGSDYHRSYPTLCK